MFTKQEMNALPKGTQVVFVGVSNEEPSAEAVIAIPLGTVMTKAVEAVEEGSNGESYCDFTYSNGTSIIVMPMLEDEIAPLTKSMGV